VKQSREQLEAEMLGHIRWGKVTGLICGVAGLRAGVAGWWWETAAAFALAAFFMWNAIRAERWLRKQQQAQEPKEMP
jgi:hypothetical protein